MLWRLERFFYILKTSQIPMGVKDKPGSYMCVEDKPCSQMCVEDKTVSQSCWTLDRFSYYLETTQVLMKTRQVLIWGSYMCCRQDRFLCVFKIFQFLICKRQDRIVWSLDWFLFGSYIHKQIWFCVDLFSRYMYANTLLFR